MKARASLASEFRRDFADLLRATAAVLGFLVRYPYTFFYVLWLEWVTGRGTKRYFAKVAAQERAEAARMAAAAARAAAADPSESLLPESAAPATLPAGDSSGLKVGDEPAFSEEESAAAAAAVAARREARADSAGPHDAHRPEADP